MSSRFVRFAGKEVNIDQIASIEFDQERLYIEVRMANGDVLGRKVTTLGEGVELQLLLQGHRRTYRPR